MAGYSVRFSSVRTKIFSFGSVFGHQNSEYVPLIRKSEPYMAISFNLKTMTEKM